MTESEAKTKWCPYQGIGVKADSTGGQRARCVASDCMAWRHAACEENENGTFDPSMHDGLVTAESGRKFIYHGYCGLAGKP